MKNCPICQQQFDDDVTLCPDDGGELTEIAYRYDAFVGQILMDKYRIERLVGRGGMGAVYEGWHQSLNRKVAIKMMHPHIVADQSAAARFIREAKLCARIDHANTVTIHDFGVLENGRAFIVMEFVTGRSLRKLITINGSLSLTQALEWFTPVCAAIEAAHKCGIIHRDLKPENVMLKEGPDGPVIKVVDFGLAKLWGGSGSVKLTQTGEVIGTPQYMAPELFENEAADPSVDIYALGIMFYEMLTGNVPFSGKLEAVISGHLFKQPAPISAINPAMPAGIDDIVALALNKRRDERIASAMEFANRLNEFAASLATTPPPPVAPDPPVAVSVEKSTRIVRSGPSTSALDEVPREPISDSAQQPTLKAESQIAAPTLQHIESEPNIVLPPTRVAEIAAPVPVKPKTQTVKLLAAGCCLVIAGGIGLYFYNATARPAVLPATDQPVKANAETEPRPEEGNKQLKPTLPRSFALPDGMLKPTTQSARPEPKTVKRTPNNRRAPEPQPEPPETAERPDNSELLKIPNIKDPNEIQRIITEGREILKKDRRKGKGN